jgi:aminoglycoside phosphotransferase (APT) family kinase protein
MTVTVLERIPVCQPARMPHGYTNDTTRDGPTVVKHYLGPDAALRRDTEARVLAALAARLPVPPVLGGHGTRLTIGFMPGRPGQDLIAAGLAEPVLAACGRMLRRVHAIDPWLVLPAAPSRPGALSRPGAVLVHGDYGPNNALLDPAARQVSTLLDWEWAHVGDAVEDLAWCEWIIRMHHPEQTGSLGALFGAYRDEPPWPDRHQAMLARCRELLDLSRRSSPSVGEPARQWQDRLAITASWTE